MVFMGDVSCSIAVLSVCVDDRMCLMVVLCEYGIGYASWCIALIDIMYVGIGRY
jgi:hypothetical protein